MIHSYYSIWEDPQLRKGFESKTSTSFFKTETHFITELVDKIDKVLDIGCASGRLIELLQSMGWTGQFVGIDIVKENIAVAQSLYPQHRFFTGNAVDMILGESFDMVNATGVMQHEPRFEQLVHTMLAHASSYVMFDVKFGLLDNHLVDLEQSYCRIGDSKAHFICLSFPMFLDFLKSIEGIKQISIFGYPTDFNKTTVVPAWLTSWISAGILLEKGKGPAEVEVDMPAKISNSGQ